MRRILLYLAAASVLCASCSKSGDAGSSDGTEVSVSFTASLPESAMTKAVADGDGQGTFADQCKIQVWMGDILFFEKTVAVTDMKARFENIILMKDQKYDFLFWADNKEGAYYETDDLSKVRLAGDYVGGKDSRDAFSASITGKTVSENFSQSVVLTRPFGQLNVITTDIPELYGQFADKTQLDGMLPGTVSLKMTAPTVFDVRTGKASVPALLSYSAPMYTGTFKTESGAKNTLSMDYLFAPAEEGNVVDVEFSASNPTSGLVDIKHSFSNIPLRRNYRTNVIGSLITVVGTITVEIDPVWSGELNK